MTFDGEKVEDQLGPNLNVHQNIEVISSVKAEGLRDILRSIKSPYQLINTYGMNGRHYAWLNTDRKLNFKRRKD